MPIVEVEFVVAHEAGATDALAGPLADALAQVFGSPPGGTWLRLRHLSRSAYAENQATLADSELPVFVTVLHAHPPVGDALATEVQAITLAVAQCAARTQDRVHVQYAPAGAGRQAFGGRLVR